MVIILICPSHFSCTFHVFEKALHKVICEQFVEWAKCRILDMVQLEIEAVYVRIAIGKCGNAVVILLRESNFEDSGTE